MGKFAKQQKNILQRIIHEVGESAPLYSVRPGKDFTRNRTLDIETIIKMLISMGGNSLSKEMFDHFKYDLGHDATVSAFVQQRDKLLPDALAYILNEYNHFNHDGKTYKGYYLAAADGTIVTYNGFTADDTYMPKSGNGVNQYHVHALYDLLNRCYIDAEIEPNPKENEPRAAFRMLERTALRGRTIFMGDRGYGSMNLIEHINRIEGCEYLIRIKDNLWKEMRSLPKGACDVDITMHIRTTQRKEDQRAFADGSAKWIPGQGIKKSLATKHWDFESPYTLKVRIVRFELKPDQYETVVTSLSRDKFSPEELEYLYGLRWKIETSFMHLKHSIGMTAFHSRKTNSIRQEILARMIMYNFCARIAAATIVRQDNGRKWTYQLNYTMGIHICMEFFRNRHGPPFDPEVEMTKYIVPVRSGRPDRRKQRPEVRVKPAVCFMYRVA